MNLMRKQWLLVLALFLLGAMNATGVVLAETDLSADIATLESEIQADPANERAYQKLASFYKKNKQWDKLTVLQKEAEARFSAPYWAYRYVPPAGLTKEARQAWLNETEARLLKHMQVKSNEADLYLFLGNIYRFQNKFTEALKYYDKAMALSPNYRDVRDSRAAVLNALERPAEALEMVALELPTETRSQGFALQAIEGGTVAGGAAPINGGKKPTEEQLMAAMRSTAKMGDKSEFKNYMLFAQDLYPERNWADEFKEEEPKYAQTLRAWHGADELSNDLASWNEQGISYSIRTPDTKNAFRVGATRNERFDNTDISYHLGYSRKITEKLTTAIDTSFGPGNQIVPRFVLAPSFTYKLPYNFSTTNTYRVARYSEQTTQAGIHNLQYTIKPINTAIGYNLRHSYIENVSTIPVSHLLYLTKFYRNNSSVTLSGGLGDAAEFIANANPPRVLEYQLSSVGIRGVHYLTKKSPWGITWGLGYTHYDGLFDSFCYQIGIQRNF